MRNDFEGAAKKLVTLMESQLEAKKRVNSNKTMSKYWHYTFVGSIGFMALSSMGIINGYLRFINLHSYYQSSITVPYQNLLGGYVGIFILRLLPIPDFITLPLIGYLSSAGLFNPFIAFIAALGGAVVPFEYFAGRLAARPILMRSLRVLRISEEKLEIAEGWILKHGPFSVFASTFVPYFYSAVALAAGTLRMKIVPYFVATIAGFGIRYAILEAAGFYGAYILTPEYDNSHRTELLALLTISIFLSAWYGVENLKLRRTSATTQ